MCITLTYPSTNPPSLFRPDITVLIGRKASRYLLTHPSVSLPSLFCLFPPAVCSVHLTYSIHLMCFILTHPSTLIWPFVPSIASKPFIHLTVSTHPMCIILIHPFTLTHPIQSVSSISLYPLIPCVSSPIHLPWPIMSPIPSSLFHLSHHIHSSHVYPSYPSITLTHPTQLFQPIHPSSYPSIYPDPSSHPSHPVLFHPSHRIHSSHVYPSHPSITLTHPATQLFHPIHPSSYPSVKCVHCTRLCELLIHVLVFWWSRKPRFS